MEKKEYLNEEEYLQNAKKLKTIGLIVLVVGLVLLFASIIMIICGFLGFGKTFGSGFEAIDSGNMNINSSRMFNGVFGGFGLIAIGSLLSMIGFAASAVGVGLLIWAHQREITAFTTQQVMPVAQEGIDKMTPTVSNAAGSLAKSISKGVAEGKKEAEVDKDIL